MSEWPEWTDDEWTRFADAVLDVERGPCAFCAETIKAGEARGPVPIHTPDGPRWAHHACGLRSVLGGIGHAIAHEHWCIERGDPDAGLTYRQSAELVALMVAMLGPERFVDEYGG